jgi:hypothetical protein
LLRSKLHIVFLTILIAGSSAAQPINDNKQENSFRNFLGKFIVSGSIGYGATFNSHQLLSGGLVQNPNSPPYLFDNTFVVSDTISLAYTNWVNNVGTVSGVPVDTSTFLLGLDSADLSFKARGTNIPINISVHYTFDRYRLGVGYSFEPYFTGRYKPTQYTDRISSFKPDFNGSIHHRWFILLGGEVLRTKRHTITVDAKFGTYSLSKKKYNASQIKKGVFFNLGVRFERALSEYVQVFLRPSFEFKNYTITFPESGYDILHSLPAFYTGVGLTWRLPDRRKCTIKSCMTQVNHHHGRKNYRSRVHPFWRWQNPDYGQNYPRLVKYKGKNKKKLNAY